MGLFSGKSDNIGIDIGKSSIIGVRISGTATDPVLRKFHERQIPEGLVFEGEVLDAESLGDELKAFVREAGFKRQSVYLGVGNQKVIVRYMEVPEMEEDELRGAIEFQAQDYIPIAVEDVVLDFQVVSHYVDDEGVGKQQVALVAAQRDMIDKFMDAFGRAGLHLAGIDVTAFALVRSLAPTVAFMDQGSEEIQASAIVNISSSVSTLVVAQSGTPKFTRILALAHDSFLKALVQDQDIPVDDAPALTQRIGVPGPEGADVGSYNPATIEQVQGILGKVAAELAGEIKRSLDYYQNQGHAHPVGSLQISGRGAVVLNLAAHLSGYLNMDVSVGSPIGKISENRSGTPDDELAIIAPRLAAAIGLALDEAD